MNEKQSLIWQYLQNNAVGINNAIHVRNIADALGFPPKGTNNDDVRALIKNMVVREKKPIGTCENGIFIFTSEIERESAAQFLERNTAAETLRTINPYNS